MGALDLNSGPQACRAGTLTHWTTFLVLTIKYFSVPSCQLTIFFLCVEDKTWTMYILVKDSMTELCPQPNNDNFENEITSKNCLPNYRNLGINYQMSDVPSKQWAHI